MIIYMFQAEGCSFWLCSRAGKSVPCKAVPLKSVARKAGLHNAGEHELTPYLADPCCAKAPGSNRHSVPCGAWLRKGAVSPVPWRALRGRAIEVD